MSMLLALDLDGTVLSFDLKLDQRDVEALHRAVAAGVAVVACTGRPFPGALPWVRRLGLDQPIVCYQGAQVRTPDGGTLLDQGVPHDLAVEVVRFARERDVHVQAYRDDRLIIERDRPEAHEYANHAGMEINLVGDLGTGIGATTPKLVMVAGIETIEALLPEVRARWAGRLEANTSMPTYLEITNHGADKRRALQFLCERLGIPHDGTVAVGDGRNDSSMLGWAARGYAVEGAAPEVIEAAGGRTVGKPGTGGIATLISELLDGD
jgi:Cof subfamily protein (haloacid dehalogenase superfamily)